MTNLAKIMLIALTLSAFGIYLTSCSQSDSILETVVDSNVDQKFTVENGMLVFESREDMDLTLVELRSLSMEDFNQWETQIEVNTIYGAFNAVIAAEDAISNYYESLPLNEQKKYRDMPEVNSDLYKEMMDRGVIKIIEDNDGTSYFGYAVIDPSMAPILNLDGFVKMENKIYQYTNKGFKIILDGDFAKIPQLQAIKDTHIDDTFVVSVEDENTNNEKAMTHNWSVNNTDDDWEFDGNRRRYKVWLDGQSYPQYGLTDTDCAKYIRVVHTVRTEAQRRNFWGKWRYTGSFSPSFSFTNQWWYQYSLYDGNVCGLTSTYFTNNIPSYSCTGNPNYPCPTSPHSASYPSTNNGFFNQTPHGLWSADGNWPEGYGYFSNAFFVDGVLTSTYNGTSFNFEYEE